MQHQHCKECRNNIKQNVDVVPKSYCDKRMHVVARVEMYAPCQALPKPSKMLLKAGLE
jgi:hypothetical protein